MRIAVASVAILGGTFSWVRRHLRLSLPATATCALLLLGCVADYDKHYNGPESKARIPLPKRALLAPPREPACTLNASGFNSEQGSVATTGYEPTVVANLAAQERSDTGSALADWPRTAGAWRQPNHKLVQSDPHSSLSQRIRLEYERDCFQQAEIRLREQLLKLQAAIDKTIRSVKRSGRGDAPKQP